MMSNMKILIWLFAPLLLLLGLNYQQLYSAWTIWSETRRLADLLANSSLEFQNPEPIEDEFAEGLSLRFWKFSIINGGGQVSQENTWHAASMKFNGGLTIHHFPDPYFQEEGSSPLQRPAAGQYNNLTLIGGSGFRPTLSSDVVLKFSSRVSENFYGTAGVIFQPLGTLQDDGIFVKPFDMFGFAIAGRESSILGINGALCYLALNWMPVDVDSLNADATALHEYEIRLRWINRTEWVGIVKVDGKVNCQMPMPSFGPVEVHVWSDNSWVVHKPRRWWEIGPTMELKYQDGGEKQFYLENIQIFPEAR